MSATSHYIDAKRDARKLATELGADSMTRLTLRFMGIALILAGIGMWLAPGASFEGDLILMKLGVSVFFTITGLTLFSSGRGRIELETAEE